MTSSVPQKVVFDTSVILSGLSSAHGSSRALLSLARRKKVHGIVSATIIREALTHAEKIHLTPEKVAKGITAVFSTVAPAPTAKSLTIHATKLSDPDDVHLLATATETSAQYLVTLDRRHLLKQATLITEVAIVTPGYLLQKLKQDR